MNAKELFLADGRSAGVWYCETCQFVRKTEAEAESCCVPHECDDCGDPTDGQYRLVCWMCSEKRAQAKLDERAAQAAPLTVADWDGYVFDGNDYHGDIGDMLQTMEDDDREPPAYVWPCRTHSLVAVDIDDIVDRICDESYEDFDAGDLSGINDLSAAIAAFNEANKQFVMYEADHSRVIWLNGKPDPTANQHNSPARAGGANERG